MKELSLEAAACRRDYMRKWRAKNRDKVREYNARYWAKRFEREKKAAEQEQKEGDTNNTVAELMEMPT